LRWTVFEPPRPQGIAAIEFAVQQENATVSGVGVQRRQLARLGVVQCSFASIEWLRIRLHKKVGVSAASEG
jgi:hypothetical protein